MNNVLFLVLLFTIKHFVVDYILQRKYQYTHKGTYGHAGGLLHAGLHGIGTYFVLMIGSLIPIVAVLLFSLLDSVIHYHVDWAKTNINAKMKWAPNSHDEYWILLGLDQFLHSLTYILIVHLVV